MTTVCAFPTTTESARTVAGNLPEAILRFRTIVEWRMAKSTGVLRSRVYDLATSRSQKTFSPR
jgi:hypothetical protein